jgi:hypothetical protein
MLVSTQAGQSHLVKDSGHASLDVGQPGAGASPVIQRQMRAFQRARPVRDHPGRVGQRSEDGPDDPKARAGCTPPGKLAADCVSEPGLAEPADTGKVTSAPIQHNGRGRTPACRAKWRA